MIQLVKLLLNTQTPGCSPVPNLVVLEVTQANWFVFFFQPRGGAG